ncbi:MAG: serine protein kinase RIO [Lentisphaeraceae bacterium]|nr:serine protein kinase RIO [Lentisphaeraceae bacterium]
MNPLSTYRIKISTTGEYVLKKVPKRLQALIHDGIIDEVVRPIQSGKEAEVYLVISAGKQRCAKVYKDFKKRSFKNSAIYREGRSERNSRRARAMAKGSNYGRREEEEAWHNAEVDALYRLEAAGVRVPKPHGCFDGILIMDVIADADGGVAPRLSEAEMCSEKAENYHKFLMSELVRMLCSGLVHGDLSEYNILIDADGPVIIDLPQAVDAAGNNSAKQIFERDVKNLARFFGRYSPKILESNYGAEIWKLYENGELKPDVKLTGHFHYKHKKVNVKEVLSEIDDARQEAEERAELTRSR